MQSQNFPRSTARFTSEVSKWIDPGSLRPQFAAACLLVEMRNGQKIIPSCYGLSSSDCALISAAVGIASLASV